MEWLLMDGSERMFYQERVDAGEAAPFEREPTEYAYLLRLTLLEVYPGSRYADTVITEIRNGLPGGWTGVPRPACKPDGPTLIAPGVSETRSACLDAFAARALLLAAAEQLESCEWEATTPECLDSNGKPSRPHQPVASRWL